MTEFSKEIKSRIKAYKQKYFLNILLRGLIFCLGLILALFLGVSILEYFGKFDSITRAVLLFGFIGSSTFALYQWVITPLLQVINIDKNLSDAIAAKQLGNHFPDIEDRLLNTLQLLEKGENDELISASIQQKYGSFKEINFVQAVDYKENLQRLFKYFLIPLFFLLAILIIRPKVISSSSSRLVEFNKEFTPEAPFSFNVNNKSLYVFKNEPFTLDITIEGDALPSQVSINKNGHTSRCKKIDESSYQYTFDKISESIDFQFEAAGFLSQSYTVEVVERPSIRSMELSLNYPKYLGKQDEIIKNSGNIEVPIGTEIEWKIKTNSTDKINTIINNNKLSTKELNSNTYSFTKSVLESISYEIETINKYNTQSSKYYINVIEDEYPTIKASSFIDSSLFDKLYVNGFISDDYGMTSLRFFYKKDEDKTYKSLPISFERKTNAQSFYYNFPLDTLKLNEGESFNYYLQVKDNDGVHGPKATRTAKKNYRLPSKKELTDKIDQSDANTEKDISNALEKSKAHKERLKEIQDKLKGKKEISWEEKQELKKLLKEHEEIKKEIEEINKNVQQNNEKKEKFNEQDKELLEKAKQIEKLMQELMNEEMQELYDELDKLMEEQMKPEDLNKLLEEMDLKNESLEKELDRNLEMLKQLQFEQKLQKNINELEKLAEKQEELSQETKEGEKSQEELKEEQEEINKEFDELKEEMNKLEEMNEDLENPNKMEDLKKEQEEISEQQEQSKSQLDKKQNKKASESQKQSAEKMKQMAKKMQDMQAQNSMEMNQENMDDLRAILENLIALSFEQEEIMNGFKNINQKDPKFIEYSQRQLKLKDDARIVEDSLYALAKRVIQIQSFITSEIEDMKKYMGKSSEIIKQRNPRKATVNQQYAMTAMNNLALLLSDVLKQMQEQMAQQKPGNQMCNKPGKGSPKMSDLQKQLNQQIKDLKKGQKPGGRKMSQQLAKLAAQQEQIRRALNEMKEGQGAQGGNKPGKEGGEGNKDGGDKAGQKLSEEIKKLEKLMKETEKDLVNKNLTQQTLQRQEQIMTRLLEAEKASKERDEDNKREAKTADVIKRENPPHLEEYLKAKEKQLELLQSIPPDLNNYYKKKVDQYFKSIN